MAGWAKMRDYALFRHACYNTHSFQAPLDYITTEEFQSMPFLKMSFYYTIWVKGILAKYIGAWLLAEGAVILSGNNY